MVLKSIKIEAIFTKREKDNEWYSYSTEFLIVWSTTETYIFDLAQKKTFILLSHW